MPDSEITGDELWHAKSLSNLLRAVGREVLVSGVIADPARDPVNQREF